MCVFNITKRIKYEVVPCDMNVTAQIQVETFPVSLSCQTSGELYSSTHIQAFMHLLLSRALQREAFYSCDVSPD